MSFQTIQIYRDYSVIDSWIQIPPNEEKDKNVVSIAEGLEAILGSDQIYLSQGSGDNHGWHTGAQSIFRLPGLIPGTSYQTDPAVILEDLV